MSDSKIWIEDKGTYLIVVSDNPSQKNVLTLEYHALQLEALKRAADDDKIAAVIFVGRSGYFSAGGELGLLRAAIDGDQAEREAPVAIFHQTIDAIRSCPKPVIAAVHGGAAGGGLSTLLACDLIVADAGATFLAAHVKIGATIDGGLTWFLGQQLPRALAMEMCLFGSVVSAEDLHKHGLVTSLVPQGHAEDEAVRLAEKLARGPVSTQAKLKGLLNASVGNSLSEHLTLEKNTLVDALGGPAAREGISAFLEKRRPDFASAEGRDS